MARYLDIPYRRIPGQSSLFLDYLDLSPGALSFFATPPIKQKLESFARNQALNKDFPRQETARILERQNALYGAGSALAEQIADLARPDSVAIVTGQQVGIFGGPLYTVYKALTAVALAEELRAGGIRAVPVFWLETEDHDFAEATRRTRLDSSSALETVDFGKLFPDVRMRPVGPLILPETIRAMTGAYLDPLPESRWKGAVREQLESAYRPGVSFAHAFARLLRSILPGLLLFDPGDPEAKRLAAPVFRKALENADLIGAELRKRAGELTGAGYHVQARVREDSTLLFCLSAGDRLALDPLPEGFRPRGSSRIFTPEELLRLTENAPEQFSPNVLLRPVVQDFLFPTAAYVAGPSEIAYFAQLAPLYALMDLLMPVIWPRNGFTLLEPESVAALERWGLDFEDCLIGKGAMGEKGVSAPGSSGELERLKRLERRLNHGLEKIGADSGAIEAGLTQAAANARSKILHNVKRLRARALRRAEASIQPSREQAFDRLLARCCPNGKLQERELGILPYLARYGPSLVPLLREEARPENFAHRVLYLQDSPRG